MRYRIVQYLQPWEIDNFERQVNQMIRCSYYLDTPKNIIWDVTLNLDIANWNTSKISKDFFIDKFKYLETIVGYHFTTAFDTDNTILGSGDKKRICAEKEQDFTIWLDSDIIFPDMTLPYIVHATIQIPSDRYILTPELVRWWDTSWDVIVNEKFINEPHEFRMSYDSFKLEYDCKDNDIFIKQSPILKFGAGWFTCLSKKVTDEIKIPIEGGPYGVDDTYFMLCGSYIGIEQYTLSGIVITEMSTMYLKNKDYIKPLLDIKSVDRPRISQEKFMELIKQFYENHVLHTK